MIEIKIHKIHIDFTLLTRSESLRSERERERERGGSEFSAAERPEQHGGRHWRAKIEAIVMQTGNK